MGFLFDPIIVCISRARSLFTLQRSERIEERLLHISSTFTEEAVASLSSMYTIADAQLDLVPFVIGTAFNALILSPSLLTVVAISPTPCFEVPSGIKKPVFVKSSLAIWLSIYTASKAWFLLTAAGVGKVLSGSFFVFEPSPSIMPLILKSQNYAHPQVFHVAHYPGQNLI